MPPFEELVSGTARPGRWWPGERAAVARFLAARAAAPADQEAPGKELCMLVRGACTMFPQALLFGVIAQAVAIEAELMAARRKRAGALPHR